MESRLTREQVEQMRNEADKLFPDPLLRQNIPSESFFPQYMIERVGDNLEFPLSGALLDDLYASDATRLLKETIDSVKHSRDDCGVKYQQLNQTLAGWGALRGHPNLEGVYQSLERQGVLPDLLRLSIESRGSGHRMSRDYLDRFVNKPAWVHGSGPYRGSREPVVELANMYAHRNFDEINRAGDSLVSRMGLNPFRDRDTLGFSDIEQHYRLRGSEQRGSEQRRSVQRSN